MTQTLNFEALVDEIALRANENSRLMVAVAGPPGAGKSTLAARLAQGLNHKAVSSIVVPMDGFHMDNAILEKRGLLPRKGAPQTFDVAGFASLLARLRQSPAQDVLIPTFDRVADLSRNAAAEVLSNHRVLVIEGNYLLLNAPEWRALRGFFDMTVALDVDEKVLEQRLVDRWLHYGLSPAAALQRAQQNDLPNAHLVVQDSVQADFVVSGIL